jgi:hypothetical protein
MIEDTSHDANENELLINYCDQVTLRHSYGLLD